MQAGTTATSFPTIGGPVAMRLGVGGAWSTEGELGRVSSPWAGVGLRCSRDASLHDHAGFVFELKSVG